MYSSSLYSAPIPYRLFLVYFLLLTHHLITRLFQFAVSLRQFNVLLCFLLHSVLLPIFVHYHILPHTSIHNVIWLIPVNNYF
jgi:hypothetical protein